MTAQYGHRGWWIAVGKIPDYFIVEATALPEIFLKVAEAKRILETGEVAAVNEATRRVGISRSAFYKYKDTVRPFSDMLHGRIVTFQILLKDEKGVLSSVLNSFAQSGGNILTINQGIPTGGCALVSVGTEMSGLDGSIEDLVAKISETTGVVRCEIVAG